MRPRTNVCTNAAAMMIVQMASFAQTIPVAPTESVWNAYSIAIVRTTRHVTAQLENANKSIAKTSAAAMMIANMGSSVLTILSVDMGSVWNVCMVVIVRRVRNVIAALANAKLFHVSTNAAATMIARVGSSALIHLAADLGAARVVILPLIVQRRTSIAIASLANASRSHARMSAAAMMIARMVNFVQTVQAVPLENVFHVKHQMTVRAMNFATAVLENADWPRT